jgi:hypothetical protein
MAPNRRNRMADTTEEQPTNMESEMKLTMFAATGGIAGNCSSRPSTQATTWAITVTNAWNRVAVTTRMLPEGFEPTQD